MKNMNFKYNNNNIDKNASKNYIINNNKYNKFKINLIFKVCKIFKNKKNLLKMIINNWIYKWIKINLTQIKINKDKIYDIKLL